MLEQSHILIGAIIGLQQLTSVFIAGWCRIKQKHLLSKLVFPFQDKFHFRRYQKTVFFWKYNYNIFYDSLLMTLNGMESLKHVHLYEYKNITFYRCFSLP